MTLLFALLLYTLPQCATEDSTDCVWDAATQGNGKGVSFLAVESFGFEFVVYQIGKVT
jgi:hypothetical protein